MTHYTTERAEERNLREILANPPPTNVELEETPRFLELQARRRSPLLTKDSIYLWGGGLLIGGIIFGTLYALLLFIE